MFKGAPAHTRRPPVSAVIAVCGLFVLVGVMVFDAAVSRLGDDLLVAIMIVGMLALIGGAGAWLDAHSN
jgi:hypothetical protein